MTENQLVVILPEEWPKLCALFRRNWPEHVFAYGLVSNYIRWKQQSSIETNVHIFSLNGTWPENGTFLLIVSTRDFLFVEILDLDFSLRTSLKFTSTRWMSSRGTNR